MITLDELLNKTDEQANPLTCTGLQAAAIDCFAAVQEMSSGTYNVLRDLYAKRIWEDCQRVEALFKEIANGEMEYADLYFTEEQLIAAGARSKSGKLFATKVLPATYINSRNTLKLALTNGIDIRGKGKSELEKLNKDAKKATASGEGDGEPVEAAEPVDALTTLEGLLATAVAFGAKHGFNVNFTIDEA